SRTGTGQGFRHAFSPVNKKGPPAARKKHPSKAPADTFCVVLFRFAQKNPEHSYHHKDTIGLRRPSENVTLTIP
ncbi:hypothetical protein ACS5I3_004839, partial [Escherichia coli]